jgi:hypothetical protein
VNHRVDHSCGVFAAVLLACSSLACSGAPPDDGRDYEIGNAPSSGSGGSGGSEPAAPAPQPTADAPPSDPPPENPTVPVTKPGTPYAGTLATTASVKFGGGTYCNYDITLKNVAVDMTVSEAGEIQSMTVKDLAVERAFSCPYPPAPQNNQVFTFATATKNGTTTHVELAGAKQNSPATSLVADVVANGAAYEASFTWKRTDQKAPLAWTVTAKVTVSRK